MQVVDQPAMSQLSVDAACFVPTNFGQSVASTSDEVPSYFDSYVWQGTEIKDSSPYLGFVLPLLCNQILTWFC